MQMWLRLWPFQQQLYPNGHYSINISALIQCMYVFVSVCMSVMHACKHVCMYVRAYVYVCLLCVHFGSCPVPAAFCQQLSRNPKPLCCQKPSGFSCCCFLSPGPEALNRSAVRSCPVSLVAAFCHLLSLNPKPFAVRSCPVSLIAAFCFLSPAVPKPSTVLLSEAVRFLLLLLSTRCP